jgi:hypothetical protein
MGELYFTQSDLVLPIPPPHSWGFVMHKLPPHSLGLLSISYSLREREREGVELSVKCMETTRTCTQWLQIQVVSRGGMCALPCSATPQIINDFFFPGVK